MTGVELRAVGVAASFGVGAALDVVVDVVFVADVGVVDVVVEVGLDDNVAFAFGVGADLAVDSTEFDMLPLCCLRSRIE